VTARAPWKLAAGPWGWVVVLRFAGLIACGRWAPWTWRLFRVHRGRPPVRGWVP